MLLDYEYLANGEGCFRGPIQGRIQDFGAGGGGGGGGKVIYVQGRGRSPIGVR